MYIDPLKGRNPFAVARLIRNGAAPCPECGGRCSLVSEVRDDEVIAIADCAECGEQNEVSVSVDDNSDVVLEFKGKEYLSTFEEKSLSESTNPDVRADFDLHASAANACIRSGRPFKGISIWKDMASVCKDNIGKEGWGDAVSLCVKSVIEAASAMSGQAEPSKAIEYLESYREIAESDTTAARINYHVSLALTHLSAGDPAESVKDLRSVIEGLKDPLPEGDIFIRIRANEALGTILASKPDYKGAMRCFNAGITECNKILKEPSEECLGLLCRLSVEYAEAAFNGQMEKKGTEAVKNAVKTCRGLKDKFPAAYAESLLQRARYLNIVDAIDPGMRDSMNEAISILGEPDKDGRYHRLLPLAYYYRSASSGKKDSLDIEDLASAYRILRDNLTSGQLPDGVMYSVSETYVQYLDLFDQDRSRQVRGELAQLGFVFPPPPELKKEESS